MADIVDHAAPTTDNAVNKADTDNVDTKDKAEAGKKAAGKAGAGKKAAGKAGAGKGKKAAGKGKGKKAAVGKKVAEASQALLEQVKADIDTSKPAVVYVEHTTDDGCEVRTVQRTQRKRKRVDPVATLAKYRERISAERTAADFAALDGAWLSDFKLYTNDPALDHSGHHGNVLIELAKSHGATPKGLCAENQKSVEITGEGIPVTKEKRYVQADLPDGTKREDARVVFIGAANRFTGHEASPWALLHSDTVYHAQ